MATLLDTMARWLAREPAPPAPPVAALPAPESAQQLTASGTELQRKPQQQRLAYAGAKRDRSNYDWNAARTGPNKEIWGAAQLLRDRSRDLVRNNPHARKAVEVLASNIVGTGIRAKCTHPDETVRRTVDELWARWQEECSAESDLEWTGLQTLAVTSWLESGEVLVRRRWRRLEDGLAVPLQLELIEADQLWEYKNEPLPTGGTIVQGVEFNPIGQRENYWILRRHPGEYDAIQTTITVTTMVARVPAVDICHLYRATRPKQVRGVPWLSTVIMALRDLDQYQVAERVRKRSQAGMVGVIIPADDATYDADSTDAVGTAMTDADGNIVDDLEPGSFFVARNGKDVRFSTPVSDAGYSEWMTTQLRMIATGCLVTHEQLSGDLSQVNYSSIRLGILEFQRLVDVLRRQIVVPLMCKRVWRWFIEAAILAGELTGSVEDYPCTWVMPHREEIDRETAVRAAILEMRAGLRSRTDEIVARGDDPDEVLAEMIADLQATRDADIWLDSDPNKANGGAPVSTVAEPAAAAPAAGAGAP